MQVRGATPQSVHERLAVSKKPVLPTTTVMDIDLPEAFQYGKVFYAGWASMALMGSVVMICIVSSQWQPGTMLTVVTGCTALVIFLSALRMAIQPFRSKAVGLATVNGNSIPSDAIGISAKLHGLDKLDFIFQSTVAISSLTGCVATVVGFYTGAWPSDGIYYAVSVLLGMIFGGCLNAMEVPLKRFGIDLSQLKLGSSEQ